MDGGNNQQQPNTPSLREEIANILPQKNEAGSKPGQAPVVPPKLAPQPFKPKTADNSQKFVLRTMPSDLEDLKQGQAPSGFNVEKSGKTVPRPSQPIPSQPPPKIELGPEEKAAPIAPAEPAKPAPAPKFSLPTRLPPKVERPAAAPPSAAPPVAPPEKKAGFLKWIIIALIAAIIVYSVIWFVFIREVEEPEPSPTPAITTPTPAKEPLSEVFGVPGEIVIPLNQFDPMEELLDAIDSQLINLNETGSFIITDEAGNKYDFAELMEFLGVSVPANLTGNLGVNDYVMIVYGQTEDFDGQGNLVITSGSAARFKRIGFVIRVDDTIAAEEGLLLWEDTIGDNLNELFGIGDRTPSKSSFGDNIYNGVNIRYMNFPYPDLSIDYAITSSFLGENYLVITNSREAIYVAVDKLLGFLAE